MMGSPKEEVNGINPYPNRRCCDSGNFRYIYAANFNSL